MRKGYLLLITLFATLRFAIAQTPAISTYPATTIVSAGGNASVTPAASPVNATGMSATTTPLFKGSFRVNPITGVLGITNAYPAGTYTIRVKAWNANGLTIDSFLLTVGNNGCSQGSLLITPGGISASRPYSVATADFNNDGHQDLVATNSTSGNASVRLGNGAGDFSGTTDVSMIYDASEIATADFNGDGKADIVAGGSYNTSVAVRFGNGNGTFGPVSTVSSGEYTHSIITADFNNDGKADLAAVAFVGNSNIILIRLSDGAGGFINAPNCSVGGSPQQIVAGDFNNDGNLDLAISVSQSSSYDYTVYVRFGDGNGNFYGVTGTNYFFQGAQAVTVADMNNDGNQDIVATMTYYTGYVYVFLGNGAGGFAYTTEKAIGNSTSVAAVADFNGDGKMDVLVSNSNGNTWATSLGNGAGGLSNALMNGGYGSITPGNPVAADFNEDGLMDVAIPNSGGGKVLIVINRIAEINVRGNGMDIPDGSTNPSIAGFTDFGNVSNRLSRTYTIQNTGTGALTVKSITTSSADSAQFVIGATTFPLTVAPGGAASFTVTFIPTSAGQKVTTLKIINDDCDEAVYDFAIQGNAIAIVPALGTYTAATPVLSGGNLTITPSAVPANAVYLFTTVSPNFKGQLTIDSLTGTMKILSAQPTGTYTIQLKAINGFSSATTSFSFTVANPYCSNPGGNTNLPISGQLSTPVIADFNGDGKQDFAVCNIYGTSFTIRYGNDSAAFNSTTTFLVPAGTYALAAGDINGDGRTDMLATSGNNNNVVSVLIATPTGGFNLAGTVSVGTSPTGIAIADVNNDGKPDFITANNGSSSSTVSVRLGDGLGSFSGNTEITVGTSPYFLVTGDVNNDGKTDFIANATNATLAVRLGNGAGGFTNAPNITLPSNAVQVSIADFNNDGKPDIATANYTTGNVSVRLGDGTGNFTGTTNYAIGTSAACVATGDFNGDGKTDFVAGDATKASFRSGDGTGNFTGFTTLSLAAEVRGIAVSDFNNDGRTDFAINCRTPAFNEFVAIRTGGENDINLQGNGVNIATGSTMPNAANYTDFGTGNNSTRTFSIQNTGTANLVVGSIIISGADSALFAIGGIILPFSIPAGSAATFTVTFTPVSAGQKTTVIRLNSDDCDEGIYSFAVKATSITPVLGNYPATVVAHAGGNVVVMPLAVPSLNQFIAATAPPNFKGILQADSATGKVTITNAGPEGNYIITVAAYNNAVKTTTTFSLRVNAPACSQGLFSAADISLTSYYPYQVTVTDFNADGRQDFLLGSPSSSNVLVNMGDGNGGINATFTMPVGAVPFALAAGDFNGDGKQDFLSSSATDSYVRIRLGDGAGGFTAAADVAMPGTPQSIAVADFNGDGRLDFVTENSGYISGIPLRLGNGKGGFTDGGYISQVSYSSYVYTADLNNDGIADLLVKTGTSAIITILFGNGAGGFAVAGTVSVGINYKNITTADFNNDGFQDIATVNEGNNTVSIFLGNGAGIFTSVGTVFTGTQPQAIVTGDFNADGNPDLAVTSYGSSSLTIATGNGAGGFTSASTTLPNYPQGIATGDFNSDGLIDIAVAVSGNPVLVVRLGAQNDINLKGNNVSIPTGSTTPSLTNYTNFGNVGSSLTRTFTVQNTGMAALVVSAVNLSGPDSAQFSRMGITTPVTIAAGDSLKLMLTFVPASPGQKNATVTVLSNDCDEAIYSFSIQGTGVMYVPTLGSYPAAAIATTGGNTIVSPNAPPTDATNITASAGLDFKGQLRVDATTGAVYITNAYPAGTYTVLIKVNGLSSAISSFTLTVGNTNCSQGFFSGSAYFFTSGYTYTIAVTDLNNDGKQDIVYPTYGLNVQLGNGVGGFSNPTSYSLPANYSGVVANDFNGDGKTDIVCGPNLFIGNGTGALVRSPITLPLTLGFGYLATGDFNRDGKADLLVPNYNDSSVYTLLGNGAGGFTILGKTVVRSGPGTITVADFNNDGYADFVVATYMNGGGFSVRLGDGAGNFSGTANLVTGSYPYGISTADFNRDGYQDLLISNYAGNTVLVRLGDGTGSFATNSSVVATGSPYGLAVADFNGDSKLDFLTAGYSSNTVMLHLGDGAGNFQAGVSATVSAGNYPLALATGDFNNDGLQDIVISANGDPSIVVRLGNVNEINVKGSGVDIADGSTATTTANFTDFGTVGYSLQRSFTIQNTGQVNLSVSAIRFSGSDSTLFVLGGISLPVTIVAGSSANFTINFSPATNGSKTTTVNILNNDCDEAVYDFVIKGLAAAPTPALGNYPATVIASGGNTTITPSAAPVNVVQATVYAPAGFKGSVLVNKTTGVITVINAYPAGNYAITVKTLGISPATSSFMLTVNDAVCSHGVFSGTINNTLSGTLYGMVLGDFNKDGKQDFATANYSAGNIGIGLGDGTGNFTISQSTANLNTPTTLATSDFNGDGNQDLVLASSVYGIVYIRYGTGAGTFTGTYSLNTTGVPRHVATGDFNGDGRPDFVIANSSGNNISVYLGDGAGAFNPLPGVPVGASPIFLLVTDFNNDGKQDIIVVNSGSQFLSVLAGNGSGGFTALPDVVINTNPQCLAADDINKDGKQDLLIGGGPYLGSVVALLGNGNGGFSTSAVVDVGGVPAAITAADFNGDGKTDLAAIVKYQSAVIIRLGDGLGGFAGNTIVTVPNTVQDIAIGDLNGDSKLDFITANYNGGTFSVRLNSDKEINLTGNGNNIPAGNNMPSIATNTDFGTVASGVSVTNTYTIQNTGSSNLVVNNIMISGADSMVFTVAGISFPMTIAPRSSTTFTLTFIATGNGLKTATVTILNNDCDEAVYLFAVKGLASCTSSSTVNTWLGNTANWNTGNNWSLGSVPTACTRVVVNSGALFMPEVSGLQNACYSLTLNNGATITIKTGSYLNITENN